MKKYKKWFYLALIIMITATILFLYVSFNSTFIAKSKAKQIALAYLDEVYGDDYTYERTSYTFVDKSYYVRFTAPVPSGIFSGTVEVGGGLWPNDVLYVYSNDASPDPEQDEQINARATQTLKDILADFPIQEAYYDILSPTILGYTEQTFSIFDTHKMTPSISIYLTDEKRSLEDVRALGLAIQQIFITTNIYFTEFYVYQNTLDNKSYAIRVTKSTIETVR